VCSSDLTRIQEMEKKLKKDSINIIERSVYTDRNVFAKNCHDNGLMNDIEWCDYTNWHDWLCSKFDIQPDLYIYLRVEPEVSFSRLQKRSRSEEEGVPLDYLRQIHQKHEDWLIKLDNVIIIDGNIEFETDPKRLNEIIEIIKNNIQRKN
jgi:deoxyadenosine/deoxycytidine kinase